MPRGGRRGPRRGAGRLNRGGIGRGQINNVIPASSVSQQDGGFSGFTLADEARQTSQHDHSTWSENSLLRNKPVAFVNAGLFEPSKQLDDAIPKDETIINHHATTLKQDIAITEEKEKGSEISNYNANISGEHTFGQLREQLEEPVSDAKQLFYFDTQPQRSPAINATPVTIPERSLPEECSSSDEIILFRGREAGKIQNARVKGPSSLDTAHLVTEYQVLEEGASTNPINERCSYKSRKGQYTKGKNKHKPKPTMEDDILADYVSNLQASGEMDSLFAHKTHNQRDLGGSLPSSADNSEPDNETGNNISFVLNDTTKHEDNSQYQIEERMGDIRISEQSVATNDSNEDEKLSSWERVEGRQLPGDDFDFMDWENPSLRRKKGKGKRPNINFDVSDSEIEMKLQAAWRTDRLRKSERKKQREEQRALGLLGKNTNPEDLRVKYPTGMSMDQIAEELKLFLMGSSQSLTLPPMDKHARKVVHDLANKFNIKSKSTGNKDTRRPTLYRTARTLEFTDKTFQQAISRVHRRHFPRMDQRHRGQNAHHPRSTNVAGVSYREGEVVGGEAPELGSGNRGRAMLEKMGWSSGTALGAMDNKGILQPVSQTMKKSKAGLG